MRDLTAKIDNNYLRKKMALVDSPSQSILRHHYGYPYMWYFIFMHKSNIIVSQLFRTSHTLYIFVQPYILFYALLLSQLPYILFNHSTTPSPLSSVFFLFPIFSFFFLSFFIPFFFFFLILFILFKIFLLLFIFPSSFSIRPTLSCLVLSAWALSRLLSLRRPL